MLEGKKNPTNQTLLQLAEKQKDAKLQLNCSGNCMAIIQSSGRCLTHSCASYLWGTEGGKVLSPTFTFPLSSRGWEKKEAH